MFDFLKVLTTTKKPAAAAKKPPRGNSRVEFDGKSFPIGAITPAGMVATGFDGSLIKGQNARINVIVDDHVAKFSFATTVIITDTSGGNMTAQWSMLAPDTEALLRKYAALKKQKAGR